MVYQSELRPAFVDPIPEPREQAKRLMLAVALIVDGFLDQNPKRFQPYLENCFFMPEAGLIVGGTFCRRPVVLREFADVCRASELDGILVRLPEVSIPALVTFDLKQAHNDRMLCVYRLWLEQPGASAWLIPTAGSGPFVRLDPLGLEIGDRPPFSCEVERFRGLKFGSEFLSVAVQGWF